MTRWKDLKEVKKKQMSKQIVIIGAGGHAKVIADIIQKSGDIVYGFLDDKLPKGTIIANDEKLKVIGDFNTRLTLPIAHTDLEFIVAIGDNERRKEIAEKNVPNMKYYTAIHPSANIGIDVTIEEGTVIMANTCINSSAQIGKHCIINTGAIIEHDNQLENYVHISPNATLSGTVKVGESTHIGASATIKNNINITSNCVIGAGAVVVKSIEAEGTYVGVPAKLMKG